MSRFLDQVFLLGSHQRKNSRGWTVLDPSDAESTKTHLLDQLKRAGLVRVILAGVWKPAPFLSLCVAVMEHDLELLLAQDALACSDEDSAKWTKALIQIHRLGGSGFSVGQLTTLLTTHARPTALVCTEVSDVLHPLWPDLPK